MRKVTRELLTQTQLGNQRTIALDVLALEVVQQTATLTNHQQQTTAGVVVVLVVAQMLVQVIDARGQQRDLNLGRTGVALMGSVLSDNSRLVDQCWYYSLIHCTADYAMRRRRAEPGPR